MKKKFQNKALSSAESITGRISNKIALSETTNNKISATALYPIKPANGKQIPPTKSTAMRAIKYCVLWLYALVFKINNDDIV